MFKLVENQNAQKIASLVLLSLPIYIMVSFVYDAFKKHEGFANEDPAAKMQEMNDQILSDIQQLQELEKALYEKMEGLSAAKKLTQKAKDDIIANINELSQLRMNLYASLKNNYDHYQTTSITTSNTYDEQTTAVAVVEKELNDAKAKLESMQDDKNNKMRYIGINTYYGKQYDEHSKIMKIIIFMCIPIIILSALASKEIISATIVAVASGIIIAVGILFLGRTMISILNRDNMNYDRIDWSFNPSDAPDDSDKLLEEGEEGADSDPWAIESRTCVGQECCDQNSTYDETQNICTLSDNNSSNSNSSNSTSTNKRSTESMCSMNNGGKYAPQYSSYEKSEQVEKEGSTPLNNYVVFSK
jgi:hypothetical protein